MQAASFENRHRRHEAELLGFLRRRAPERAEELAQEVWLRMSRTAATFDSDAQFRGYLFTVARRLLIDHHRSKRSQLTLVALGHEPEGGESADARVRQGEVLAVVQAALAELPADTAQVVRWRLSEDATFKELAARQGVPLGTALARMHRGTQHIRRRLVEAGLVEEP